MAAPASIDAAAYGRGSALEAEGKQTAVDSARKEGPRPRGRRGWVEGSAAKVGWVWRVHQQRSRDKPWCGSRTDRRSPGSGRHRQRRSRRTSHRSSCWLGRSSLCHRTPRTGMAHSLARAVWMDEPTWRLPPALRHHQHHSLISLYGTWRCLTAAEWILNAE